MKVLVYGGTGSQGSPVVTTLIERGHTPVVFTRNTEKAKEKFGSAAQYVQGDMSDAAATRTAAGGVDAIALMIPFFTRNPIEDAPLFARNAVEGAKAAGVNLIVYNTSGPLPADGSHMPGAAPRIYTRKLLAESGIPHIILAPTAYMENLLGPWTVNEIREKDMLPYPNPPQVRVGWIATQDVAALQVAALEHPELADATYIVSGTENPTGPELAEQVGKGLGRKITYRDMPLDEFATKIDAVFGPGAGAGAKAGYEYAREHADEAPPMWVDMAPLLETLNVDMTSISAWAAQMKPLMTPQQEPSA